MLGLAMQVARVGEFGLGEGVDGSGVTTKILTCNCSVDLFVENKSKLFGLHIHPPTMDLFFGRLPFAISHVRNQVHNLNFLSFVFCLNTVFSI